MNALRRVRFPISIVSLLVVVLALCSMSTVRPSPALATENVWEWKGLTGFASAIATDPLHPDVVYTVLDERRLMKSANGGEAWENVTPPNIKPFGKLAMAFDNPDIVYVLDYEGTIYLTQDGGKTWSSTTLYPEKSPEILSISVSPVNWREVYIVTYTLMNANPPTHITTVQKTTDAGGTWSPIWKKETPADVIATLPEVDNVIIHRTSPHILFLTPRNDGLLYKSIDGGQNWTSISPPTLATSAFAIDPQSVNTIYLGSPGWKSIDSGTTWRPLANGLAAYITSFVINPDNTQVIYAATGENNGVMESLDGGDSWTPFNVGIQGSYVGSLALASRNPLTFYAAVGNSGVWKITRTEIEDFSVTVNDGDLFTNQADVTLTLTAPPGTTEMQISNDGGFAGAVWEPFVPQKPWSIVAFGNSVLPRTVYVKFRTLGTISGLYQDDIILDTTAPGGTVELTDAMNITLVDDMALRVETEPYTVYLPVVAKDNRPGFLYVTMRLAATDDVSGVSEMIISSDADFREAAWEPYLPTKSQWLPDTGSSHVYVKFKDRAGNESVVVTTPINP